MAILKNSEAREILNLFELELNLLIQMNKLEKMAIRKRISNTILPLLEMDIHQVTVFMDIIEQKLHDLFDLFVDGYEFRKKLEKKISKMFKKRHWNS